MRKILIFHWVAKNIKIALAIVSRVATPTWELSTIGFRACRGRSAISRIRAKKEDSSLPRWTEKRRMNCVQYRDRDCGPRDRIDRLIRRGRMVLLPTARPGADVSALSLYIREMCIHTYTYIDMYIYRYLLAQTSRTTRSYDEARMLRGPDAPSAMTGLPRF